MKKYSQEQLNDINKVSIIPLINPYASIKYLGCVINASGNNYYQFKQIEDITSVFSSKMKSSHLPTNYIYTA